MNRLRILVWSGLAAGLWPGLAVAREAPGRLVDFSVGDWRLNNQAKRAVDEVPELAKLKLGITVKNRVATLFGKVPSEELSKLAETTLKGVSGLASVVNECTVAPPEDTTAKDIAKEVRERLKPAPKADSESDPGRFARPVPAASSTAESRQVLKPPVTLGAPETASGEHAAMSYKGESLDKLRAEGRRLGLSVEFRRGEVTLTGRVETMGHAWDLAEKLAELPEVDRVLFGAVTKR